VEFGLGQHALDGARNCLGIVWGNQACNSCEQRRDAAIFRNHYGRAGSGRLRSGVPEIFVLRGENKKIGVAPSALFMVVMAISDILTLYFFWVVKDEGSWLEIGSTISHFAIASFLCVFIAVLEGLSSVFIAGVEVEGTAYQASLRRGGETAQESINSE